MAARTSLACIRRWDKQQRHTSNCSLVTREESQLVKRPIVGSTSLSLASRLLVQAIPNTRQVFKSKCGTGYFCISDKCFADVVVDPSLKSLFSPRKPSRQAPARTSAFGLNTRSYPAVSITGSLQLLTVPRLACTSSSDVPSPQIDANHLRSFTRWWCINLNYKIDVIVTFAAFIQRCTGQSLTPEQGNLIATNRQPKVNSSRLKRNSYPLFCFYIEERANVQINRCWSEFVNLFDCFGITKYATDGLTDVIRFQPCSFSNWFVDQMVKLRSIPAFFAECDLIYLVAGISKSLQCCVNFGAQLYRDYQLTLYRQGLSHTQIITHPSKYRLVGSLDLVRLSSPAKYVMEDSHSYYRRGSPGG